MQDPILDQREISAATSRYKYDPMGSRDPLKNDFARSDRARINPAFLCFETLNFELYATILSHFGVM